MKHKNTLAMVLALGLIGGLATTVWSKDRESEDAEPHQAKVVKPGSAKDASMQVVARAEVTKRQAAKIALSRVPHGKIKDGELEMEDGVLIWTFDLSMPGTELVAEVGINAVTSKLVDLQIEAPEDAD